MDLQLLCPSCFRIDREKVCVCEAVPVVFSPHRRPSLVVGHLRSLMYMDAQGEPAYLLKNCCDGPGRFPIRAVGRDWPLLAGSTGAFRLALE